MVVVLAAMDQLFQNMLAKVSADVSAPMLVYAVRAATVGGWMTVLALGTALTWMSSAPQLTGPNRLGALVNGVTASTLSALAVAATVALGLDLVGTLEFAIGTAIVGTAAIIGPIVALRAGKNAPPLVLPAVDAREGAAMGLAGAISAIAVLGIGALAPGLSLAMLAIANIPFLSGTPGAPTPVEAMPDLFGAARGLIMAMAVLLALYTAGGALGGAYARWSASKAGIVRR